MKGFEYEKLYKYKILDNTYFLQIHVYKYKTSLFTHVQSSCKLEQL